MNYEHGESQPDFASGNNPRADLLQELQGALIWETDAWAIHFSLLNVAAAPMLGLAAGDIEAGSGILKKHIHPDDWCQFLRALYAAAAEGGIHTHQHRMIRTDGSMLWTQTSVHRSARSNGSLVVRGVSVDISKLKEQEQALRDAEEHERLLIQNLREYGVFMVGLDGHVMSWNPGAKHLKGYTAAEAIGSHISRIFPEDEVKNGTLEHLLEQAELEGYAEYEGWLVRKGGSLFWASLMLHAVIDEHGRIRGLSLVSRDLTQRRQIEQALRHSEEQFRLLVESVQDYGVFTLSPEGCVESWNRGGQRLEGYRVHEIIGAHLSRFFPPDEVEKGTPARLVRDAELRGIATYEGSLLRKNGEPFWAMLTMSAVEDENGRLRGFSNVARDLSERKRTEDALRESEEQLRLLIDSLHDYGVFMVSPDGRVATWSPGEERLKGYKAEEIIGSPITRFFPKEELDNGTPQRLVERAMSEGRAEYEGWVVRASGAKFWANVILSPVKDSKGNLRGFSHVARDLTQRMHIERAQAFLADVGTVLASSLDYRTTCDAICRLATRELAHCCILVMRTDDVIEPVAVAHVDREKEQLLRSAVKRVPYESRMAHVSTVLQSGQSKMQSGVFETVWLAEALGIENETVVRDLRARSSICVPLMVRGKVFGAIALASPPDVRYSADDLRLAEELARRAAVAVDSARLFEEAQTAARMREDVLAIVSHDLRSPLAAIRMAADHLIADSRGEPGKTLTIVEGIKRASERMANMITDLMDFSSIEGGRLRLDVADHDVAGLVAEAVDAQQPVVSARGIRIEKDVQAPGAKVRCDRERVMQVFSNLMDNAAKFTDEGGVIPVRCRLDGTWIVFTVSDSGPGIAEADLPHIFDRYWQAQRRSRGSLGLGLAISKGIVESHGGSIWVESKMGHGTTFGFRLPVSS